jgi:hypothetical protein
VIRLGGALAGDLLRLDLHPADLEHPRHVMALERALEHSRGRRTAITYAELLAGAGASGRTAAGRRAPTLISR